MRTHRGKPEDLVPTGVPWGVTEGLALILSFKVLQGLLSPLSLVLGEGLVTHLWVGFVSDAAILVIVVTVVSAAAAASKERGRPARALLGLVRPPGGRLKQTLAAVLAGAIAYVAVAHAVTAGLEFFGTNWQELPAQPLSQLIGEAEGGVVIVAACFLGIVVAPLTEEVLFRAMLYLPLRARLGPVAAAVLVGVLFSLCHFYLPGAAHFFVLSLMFTAVFECTGSLWVAVVTHGAYNGIRIILLRLAPVLG